MKEKDLLNEIVEFMNPTGLEEVKAEKVCVPVLSELLFAVNVYRSRLLHEKSIIKKRGYDDDLMSIYEERIERLNWWSEIAKSNDVLVVWTSKLKNE